MAFSSDSIINRGSHFATDEEDACVLCLQISPNHTINMATGTCFTCNAKERSKNNKLMKEQIQRAVDVYLQRNKRKD